MTLARTQSAMAVKARYPAWMSFPASRRLPLADGLLRPTTRRSSVLLPPVLGAGAALSLPTEPAFALLGNPDRALWLPVGVVVVVVVVVVEAVVSGHVWRMYSTGTSAWAHLMSG
jgi:hypothetical protein